MPFTDKKGWLVFALAALVLTSMLIGIDALERLHEFTRTHEDWELDEIVLAAVALVVSYALAATVTLSRERDRLRDALTRLRGQADAIDAARREAESASVAKSRFLAMMSHELRTPLNAVIGYAEMLGEEASDRGDAESAADLERIRTAGRHLLALINDVLDLTKIEAGRMEVAVERFAVGPLVEEIAASIESLATERGNRLEVIGAVSAGEMTSDPLKVRQIIYNLLSNAAKFTADGRIAVETSREGDGSEAWIVFRVSDTGEGIDEPTFSRLFEPFVQGESFLTRTREGTGLGLALTRRFCELLGGGVEARSVPGEGSTFTVRLPVRCPGVSDDPLRTTGPGVDEGRAPAPGAVTRP